MSGSVVFISGANQGIGFQVAKELAAHGRIVYIGSRNLARGVAAAAEIGSPNVHAIQLEVTDKASIAAAVKKIETEQGHLDLLINNAAIIHGGDPNMPFMDVLHASRATIANVDEVRKTWEVNVFSIIEMIQACLPLLRRSKTGRIINVTSGFASMTYASQPDSPYRQNFSLAYAGSKVALSAVTLSFAIELEAENIRVSLSAPSFTATANNQFYGTEKSLEKGAKPVVDDALNEDLPSGSFNGPLGPIPF